MDERVLHQLDKILALADSSHDGEAIMAVRKARQILLREGMGFADLARAAFSRPRIFGSSRLSSFFARQDDDRDLDNHYLHEQLKDLRAQIKTQDLQLNFWRRRAIDFEKSSLEVSDEAERWKNMARERANDFGDSALTAHDRQSILKIEALKDTASIAHPIK